MNQGEMGCRSPVTVVSFLPPSKIVTTNYLMDFFFCNFFHFFFNFCPQKLFVENTPSQIYNMRRRNFILRRRIQFLRRRNSDVRSVTRVAGLLPPFFNCHTEGYPLVTGVYAILMPTSHPPKLPRLECRLASWLNG
jgi:hypothetical protein